MSLRRTNLLCDVLFWLSLYLDVFGACYWAASQVATVLIGIKWLRPGRALMFALIAAALVAFVVLTGVVSIVKRNYSSLLGSSKRKA